MNSFEKIFWGRPIVKLIPIFPHLAHGSNTVTNGVNCRLNLTAGTQFTPEFSVYMKCFQRSASKKREHDRAEEKYVKSLSKRENMRENLFPSAE